MMPGVLMSTPAPAAERWNVQTAVAPPPSR
jgi:hypothetical protein